MQFYFTLEAVPPDFGPSAVTIGKFDGVHAGHLKVIADLRAAASAAGLVSTVLTFDRHPLALLAPSLRPMSLTSNEQKRDVLGATGIDAMVVIEFTEQLRTLSPEQFVQLVLIDALHAKLVLVGPDFRFGHGGSGDVRELERLGELHGFDVRSIEAVTPDGESAISSTSIRHLLTEGDVTAAAALLGRHPSVRGMVVRGEQRGRAFGYPTANLAADLEGFIPADGVYAALVTVDGVEFPAAVSVGNNPTFVGVPEKQVEAHLLDVTMDLYDKTIDVAFVEYIRGMWKFDGIDPLIAQMKLDESNVRGILGVAERQQS
jgi:riboflavin kinase/FMN adenylyltransferase